MEGVEVGMEGQGEVDLDMAGRGHILVAMEVEVRVGIGAVGVRGLGVMLGVGARCMGRKRLLRGWIRMFLQVLGMGRCMVRGGMWCMGGVGDR